ncbi:MAG: hypothetical protein PUI29_04745 [Aeromonadales bacterium]|nr:hypothetical protein [Aeromonadales bacterium]MDY2890391.1 hypothetical protein [Succinivibrio sp.]
MDEIQDEGCGEKAASLGMFTLRIARFLCAYLLAFSCGAAFCGVFIFDGDLQIHALGDLIRTMPRYFTFPFVQFPVISGLISSISIFLAALWARSGNAAELGLAWICSCWFNPVFSITVLTTIDIIAER